MNIFKNLNVGMLIVLNTLAMNACGNVDQQNLRQEDSQLEGTESGESSTFQLNQTICANPVTARGSAACSKLIELQNKFSGKDVVIGVVAAASAGTLAGYVIYDLSDMKIAIKAKTKPKPIEKVVYGTDTINAAASGIAVMAVLASDGGSPAITGYGAAALVYDPSGGFAGAVLNTPVAGLKKVVIPF